MMTTTTTEQSPSVDPAPPPPAPPHGTAGRAPRDPGPARRRLVQGPLHLLRRLTVRTRVLVAVVAAMVVGTLLTGAVAGVVQLRQVDERVDAALAQEVAELRAFAESGLDPATGQPFDSTRSLLFASVQRTVTDTNEGVLVVVDGAPYGQPGERRLRLEAEPQVLALAASMAAGDPPRFATVQAPEAASGAGHLRLVATPVSVVGDPTTGVLLVGYDMDAERGEVLGSLRTSGFVALGVLALVGLVASAAVGRLLDPLQALRRTAQRIREDDLTDRIPVRGHDDVSELARTVNGMLDRLEGAFTAQRSLLDDVGHELRTPLTVVRGHIELLDPDDPDDVRATQALTLDELDRMHRLVEELTLLAQSQRPDFLRPEEVDVDALVKQVVAQVGPIAARRWKVDSACGAVVLADPQRLVQALVQLVTNAVTVTDDQDEIGLGASATADGGVRLWVRDTGPGVDPADAERIFQRFEQGRDGTRARSDTRTSGGSGLGLSIVSAIAEAHGGQVALTSTPGAGAVFSLELPQEALR